MSMKFMTSRKKCSLLGQARKRTESSKVNHTMQIVSIRKNGSVMSGTWNRRKRLLLLLHPLAEQVLPHLLQSWCRWWWCWRLYSAWTRATFPDRKWRWKVEWRTRKWWRPLVPLETIRGTQTTAIHRVGTHDPVTAFLPPATMSKTNKSVRIKPNNHQNLLFALAICTNKP